MNDIEEKSNGQKPNILVSLSMVTNDPKRIKMIKIDNSGESSKYRQEKAFECHLRKSIG